MSISSTNNNSDDRPPGDSTPTGEGDPLHEPRDVNSWIQQETEKFYAEISRRKWRFVRWDSIRQNWTAIVLFLLLWAVVGTALLWRNAHQIILQERASQIERVVPTPEPIQQESISSPQEQSASPALPEMQPFSDVQARHLIAAAGTKNFLLSLFGTGGFLLLFFMLVYRMKLPQVLPNRRLCVVSLAMAAEIALSGVIATQCMVEKMPVWALLSSLPLALFPAVLTHLLGKRIAALAATLMALLLPMLLDVPDHHYRFFYYALFLSLVSIQIFHRAQKRMDFITYGAGFSVLVYLGQLIFALDMGMLAAPGELLEEFVTLLREDPLYILAPLANGTGTGIACIILLPVLEKLFSLATPASLYEMSDVNTPLLQRLRNEAPGTYYHSLDVADLATNAAIEIGADPRLANAMALYHDIGKLYAPMYFAENITPGSPNPHDKLKPEESHAIILQHVTVGQECARNYHLSSLIIPAILQHHGTSRMEGFYAKAKQQAERSGQPPPDENAFRYNHSIPSSREVALVSLADGCEAAVRALFTQQPDADSTAVDERIAQIINHRILDRQLDDAELTMAELQIIRKSFVDTIMNNRHGRPEYRR